MRSKVLQMKTNPDGITIMDGWFISHGGFDRLEDEENELQLPPNADIACIMFTLPPIPAGYKLATYKDREGELPERYGTYSLQYARFPEDKHWVMHTKKESGIINKSDWKDSFKQFIIPEDEAVELLEPSLPMCRDCGGPTELVDHPPDHFYVRCYSPNGCTIGPTKGTRGEAVERYPSKEV